MKRTSVLVAALLACCGEPAGAPPQRPAPSTALPATAVSAQASSGSTSSAAAASASSALVAPGSCFLLHEMGKGEVRRSPSDLCATRVTPASTFKIPHALAALDSGVIAGPDTKLPYNGAAYWHASWLRDHTLQSAMANSVVWYFQRIAEKLGDARERDYLARFDYGNRDTSSGLTEFWLGGSLQISPDEQERFLIRLYEDKLPVSKAAMQAVRDILVQPRGKVVNSAGEHPFAAPWPAGAVVSAKTGGSPIRDGFEVRWLVGHVRRDARSWIFVSCVVQKEMPPLAGVELAARALREEGVL